MPDPSPTTDAFYPSTRWVQYLFAVIAALGLVAMAALVLLNRRLEQAGAGGRPPDVASAENLDRLLEVVIWPLMIVLGVVALVLLAQWTYRVRTFLEVRGAFGFDFPLQLATLSWLIPGLNLVLPKLVVDDTFHRARRIRCGPDADTRVNRWVTAWWILLIAALAVLAASVLVDRSTVSGAVNANAWTAFGMSLVVLSSLTGVVALASVDNEVARAAPISAGHDPVLQGLVAAGEAQPDLGR